MGPTKRPNGLSDEAWSRQVLGAGFGLRYGRRFFRRLPNSPRCKSCLSPFAPPFGPLMRLVGKAPWPRNPKYCSACFKQMIEHRAGAEIECSFLFADVRGSTSMAESMTATAFRGLMDRFFATAADVLVNHDAVVDKFVGDEVIGLFIPALTGELHARRAIDAGRVLLSATGNDTPSPWVPVGAGINTGVAFVGAVGEGSQVEFTALGDPVNVAARLATAAGAGELLVTAAAAASAHLADAGLEHRSLALKGKSEPTEVVVLGPA
jgi:adenylate cyclase